MSTKRKMRGATTVKTRWRASDYVEPDTAKVVLVHPRLGNAELPWWPDDVEQTDLARTYSEFARPRDTPLLTFDARPLDTYNVAFSVLNADYPSSVAPLLAVLRAMADDDRPVSLVMAKTSRGLFHITGMSITERDHTKRGNAAWADVSMTLRRASDVSVRVGMAVSGGGRNFAS